MRGVERTRPAGKAKENGTEEKENMEEKETMEEKEFQQSVQVLKGEEEEDKWVQVAPYMEAGGSHLQAMADPKEEVIEERRKECEG